MTRLALLCLLLSACDKPDLRSVFLPTPAATDERPRPVVAVRAPCPDDCAFPCLRTESGCWILGVPR